MNQLAEGLKGSRLQQSYFIESQIPDIQDLNQDSSLNLRRLNSGHEAEHSEGGHDDMAHEEGGEHGEGEHGHGEEHEEHHHDTTKQDVTLFLFFCMFIGQMLK